MRILRVDKLLFEVNENGIGVLVKSVESAQRVYIRFTNTTKRDVIIWWRNFDGERQFFTRLNPGDHFNVNTFLTHPWEFTDATTNENFVVNNCIIFRAPNVVAGMRYRTNWNISIPVRTLRYTAMLAVAELLSDPDSALELDLPRDLGYELQTVYNELNDLVSIMQMEK